MLTKNSNVTVKFTGVDFGEYTSKVNEFVNEFIESIRLLNIIVFLICLIAAP